MEQLNGNEPFTLHGSDTSIMLQDFGVGRILICSTIPTVECLPNFSYTLPWKQKMSHVPTGYRSTLLLLPVSALRSSRLPICRRGLRKMCSRRLASTLQRNLPGMELPTPLWLCVTVICMCSASLPLVHAMFQFLISITGTFMFCLPRFLMKRCRSKNNHALFPSQTRTSKNGFRWSACGCGISKVVK